MPEVNRISENRSAFRALLPVALGVALLSIPACGIDSIFDDTEEEAGPPKNRPVQGSKVLCYRSFDRFKTVIGKAGEGRDWHHIVGQHKSNEAKFGKYDLNCTDNLISLPRSDHRKINGHYSRKPKWANGKTVRAWLAEKSFQEQYDYGLEVLRQHGFRHDP